MSRGRKNLLKEQNVRSNPGRGSTGAPGAGDVKSRKKIPVMAPELKNQKVAGSEKDVTS